MKLPQGYEPHEIPPDYHGKLWIEGQLRQHENAVAEYYSGVLKQALEALQMLTDGYDDNVVGLEVDAIAALKQALKDQP